MKCKGNKGIKLYFTLGGFKWFASFLSGALICGSAAIEK